MIYELLKLEKQIFVTVSSFTRLDLTMNSQDPTTSQVCCKRKIGERLVCQLEIYSLDDKKSDRKWLKRHHLKEIQELLYEPLKSKIEEIDKNDNKCQRILTGSFVRLGFVFKKKAENHTLLLSSNDVSDDEEDFYSRAYSVYREKVLVFVTTFESSSPRSVTKLAKVLNDCSQSQQSPINISNYFTKQPSSSRSSLGFHVNKKSNENSECAVLPDAPASHGKRTAIKNLVGRTSKAISKVKKKKRIAQVLQNMQKIDKDFSKAKTYSNEKKSSQAKISFAKATESYSFKHDDHEQCGTTSTFSSQGQNRIAYKYKENTYSSNSTISTKSSQSDVDNSCQNQTEGTSCLIPHFDINKTTFAESNFLESDKFNHSPNGEISKSSQQEPLKQTNVTSSSSFLTSSLSVNNLMESDIESINSGLSSEPQSFDINAVKDISDFGQVSDYNESNSGVHLSNNSNRSKQFSVSDVSLDSCKDVSIHHSPKANNQEREKLKENTNSLMNKIDFSAVSEGSSTKSMTFDYTSNFDSCINISDKQQNMLTEDYEDSEDSDLPDCSFVAFKGKRKSSVFQRALDFCLKNKNTTQITDDGTPKHQRNIRKRTKHILPSFSPTNSDEEIIPSKCFKSEDDRFILNSNMSEISSDEELECFILTEENCNDNMEDKIRNIESVSCLDEQQMKYLVLKNKKYLKTIFQGSTESQRHLDYKKGGRSRKLLNHQVHVGLFTEEQQDVVMETLMSIFCKKHHKYLEYVMKVLLPEMLIKIHMDVHNTSHTESESMMMEALSRPGGVFQ